MIPTSLSRANRANVVIWTISFLYTWKNELVHSQPFVWLTQWLTAHIFTAIMTGRQLMIVVKLDTLEGVCAHA